MTTTYTPEQAAQILMQAAETRIAKLAKSLRELHGIEIGLPELRKAIIAPHHKHTSGSTASAGIEDVPPGKQNPRGSNDALKGEMSAHPPEETSGEISADDIAEALCKACGQRHAMGKCMSKAILRDTKGKERDTSQHPDSVLPSDKAPKKVAAEASGGKIVKKATPPMAKPPSGKNMGTHVPTSVAKGVMADIARRNSPPGPESAPAQPLPKSPTPAEHEARANSFADFMPSAANTGHKPGIFGRLNKNDKLEKKLPGNSTVTQPMPTLKPAAAGLGIAGAPDKTPTIAAIPAPAVAAPAAPKPSAAAIGKPSPVLVPRPALKAPGARLATAGASKENTEGDKTDLESTKAARPRAVAALADTAISKPVAGK